MAIQSSRPTQAESLLYRVVCTVGNLLNRECKTVPVEPTTPTPAPVPSPSPEQPPTHTPSTASDSVNTSPVGNTIQPIEINQSLLGQLPSFPVMPNNGDAGSLHNVKFPSHAIQYVGSSGSSVLGAGSPASIQATEQGWLILGIQWYWWLISIFAVIFTVFATRPGGLKALLKLAKS